jgi:hypothetical protein
MVTHVRSRFNSDGAATRLAHELGAAAADLGLPVTVAISDRDDYDPGTYPITRGELVRSAVHQARLEYRWRRYLAAGNDAGGTAAHARDLAMWAGMTAKRVPQALAPFPTKPTAELSGTKAAVRLLNIDLSHLRLMDEALASGAQWALLLEDDAGATKASAAMAVISALMTAVADDGTGFVNVSESIGLAELGVERILTPAVGPGLGPGSGHSMWRASRPVTNTVCANLFRTGFLAVLRAEIVRQGLLPVAPIDWRVNAALLALHARGEVGGGTCAWVRPGVFTQRSMHGSVAGS